MREFDVSVALPVAPATALRVVFDDSGAFYAAYHGACSADDVSGDGSGVMAHVPWGLLRAEGFPGVGPETHGVGMMFLPNDDAGEAAAKALFESVVAAEGKTRVLGGRDVPVDSTVVGRLARATEPRVRQVVLAPVDAAVKGDALERELFLLRKLVEKAAPPALGAAAPDFYVCTLSCRTIVYKGMLQSASLGPYYKDLADPRFESAFAVYHRRFSTNTTPRWPLAQPMRVLGHNGEINTLQGNLNWVASREGSLSAPAWGGREADLMPLCDATASDSANLDRLAELLVRSGTDFRQAMMVLVPEAYRNHPDLVANYPAVEAFYEYFEGLQEGWDGPALLVFSDGARVGARLDRNGLRPARWWLTEDGMVYVASEVGVLGDVLTNAGNVVRKGRLGPGQMVCADLATGVFQENTEIAREVAAGAPYGEWLKASPRLADLGASGFPDAPTLAPADALRLQSATGMGAEDAAMVVESMAANGVEPTYCMGDDAPLAVLSGRPHPLADYFKQRFAQVTNPAIDPLREGLVMSLESRLGARGNLLAPGPGAYRQVRLESPILLESELEAVQAAGVLTVETFSLHRAGGALAERLAGLCADAEKAVRGGADLLILSDRADPSAWDPAVAPIPALLATGAVHHHLIRAGLRTETSIVAETAQCFSTHHAALLVGFGAHAVVPYLAYETARQWRTSPRTIALVKAGKAPDVSVRKAQANYKKAVEKGLLKILSKMGISLLSCYHGAQIFEAYGLGTDVVDAAFRGTVSRVGGMTLDDLGAEAAAFWAKGFPAATMTKLEDYGFIQSRPKGEHHVNNQAMAKLLHKAVGLGGKGAQGQGAYDAYMQHFVDSPVSVLRDCLELKPAGAPISVDEVEPVAAIVARFCTGGMSLGAISRETHETIAVAMNRIGGKSNSGEGGEDPVRWETMSGVTDGRSTSLPHLRGLRDGDLATSRIKQVASGRFGVTPQFLVNAEQLEIKIAQGAKPGEGGQLPGKKVSPYIASLRRSKPGVPLISPPPHHGEEAGEGGRGTRTRRARSRNPPLVTRTHTPSPPPPRHLLDRGPVPAHLRPAPSRSLGQGLGQARRAGRHRDRRVGRRQGQRRHHPSLRPRRRHGRVPGVVHQALRRADGDGVGGSAPVARRERAARPRRAPRRRRHAVRPGRARHRGARRGRVRVRDGGHDRDRVRHGARVPHQQLPRRRRVPARGVARPVPWHAGRRGRLLPVCGGRGARGAGRARPALARRPHRPRRPPGADGEGHHPRQNLPPGPLVPHAARWAGGRVVGAHRPRNPRQRPPTRRRPVGRPRDPGRHRVRGHRLPRRPHRQR